MALIVADRVKETTDTADGTSAYNLLGAETGFQTFSSTVGDGNTTYYACTDGTDFEIGIGTYASSTDTLARTTILQSSNSGSAVVWSAGTKDIFVTLPADKAIFEDASNNVAVGNNITVGGTVDGVDIATRDGVLTTTTTTANNAMPKAGGTFTGNVKLNDSVRVDLGTDSDLQIKHTGTQALIENDTGNFFIDNDEAQSDLHLRITTAGSSGTFLKGEGLSGSAIMYHVDTGAGGASEKLKSTSTGVTVTGNIGVSGTVDGVDIATRDGVLTTTTTTANAAMPKAGGTFTGDVIFDGNSTNITFDESADALSFDDGARAYFGSSSDLTIYHEGVSSETRLWNVTGDLNITNFANDKDIVIATDNGSGGTANYFVADGSTGEAQLYHYGSEKLATQSGGIDVTGNITVSGTVDGVDIATRDGVLTTTTTTANAAMPKAGGTFTGDIAFEGATANDFETTVTVTDPTADQTITLPDSSGTVVLLDSVSGDLTFEMADANKNIVFDKSENALWFKRPTGSDAYGKTAQLQFDAFGSAKIFDENTVGASNNGLNIVESSKLHIDTPNITYRDGDASGEETLEVTMTRNAIRYYQPELNPATYPNFPDYTHQMYAVAFADFTISVDYGSNTTFDNFGLNFVLDKDQDTVANDDSIALVTFQGKNSGGTSHSYAVIQGIMQDVTDTTEDGVLQFFCSRNGTLVNYFQLDGDGNHTLFFKPIAFEGSTENDFETTLDVVDPTQDNTLNLPDESGTIATRAHAVALASVLG